MTEIVEGLDGAELERVRALRSAGRFFWLDVAVDDMSRAGRSEGLGIPQGALPALLGYGESLASSRKFYADGQHVVFAFSCYVESPQLMDTTGFGFRPVEIHVLVCGEYVLTLHEERMSLPDVLGPRCPEGRSEPFIAYGILDGMLASAFDALNEVEQRIAVLAAVPTSLRGSRVSIATLRALSAQLLRIRRQVGPQRGSLERIEVELGRLEGLEGDDQRYFDRIGDQVTRLVSSIDAATNGMATLIDLRLNETIYWLTVVATIFLPLTFITGFFGMNFGWMIKQIEAQWVFWVFGIGSLVAGIMLIWRLVLRAAPVEVGREDF